MKRASLIIVAWNSIRDLPDCIEAAKEVSTAGDEVIVVDNHSSDGCYEYVEAHYPDVKLARAPSNLGYAGGVNLGIQLAEGEFVFGLNADIRLHRDWVSQMVEVLEDDDVGVAGCKLVYPDGKIQHAGGIIRWPRAIADHCGYRKADDGDWAVLADVDYVTGAAWGFRKSLAEAIGYLDERFWPGYYEEVDYCFRARVHGLRVVYVPSASATHEESVVFVRASRRYLMAFHQNRLRFVLKWRSPQQFMRNFAPAEQDWLRGELSSEERRIMVTVYKQTLRELVPSWAPEELPTRDEFGRICDALMALHAAALNSVN